MSNKEKNAFAPAILREVKEGKYSAFEILYRAMRSEETRILCEISTMTRRVQRTAGEVADRVDRLAASLEAGRRYGVLADGYDGLCALLAVLRSGSTAVLIDPLSAPEERADRLATVNAAEMPMTESESTDAVADRAFGSEIILFTPAGEAVTLTGEMLALELLRVETLTGEKKGILSLGNAPKLLLALPLHTGEGITALLWALALGAVTVYPTDPSAEAILRSVRNHQTDLLIAPPYVYEATERLLGQLIDGRDAKQREKYEKAMQKAGNGKAFRELHAHLLGTELSFCYCAGELRARTATVLGALGHPVTELYGNVHGFLLYRKGTRYLPLAGIDATVEEERLTVREGDAVLSDRLDAISEKEGIRLLGDRAHVAISEEGERIYAEQVEQLVDLPRVLESAVLSVEGEHLLICRIPSDLLSVQKQSLNERVRALREASPTLRRVLFTYAPLKSAGASAPDRDRLEAILSTLPTVSLDVTATDAEDSEIREALAEMFADILGCATSEIDPDGHFMLDLGGNSLDYFTLVGEINERFGITLQFEGESFGYSLNDMERKVKELIV